MATQLFQVGPATSTGFGLAPISWQELSAWADAMHEKITPFHAECLMTMSRAYVGEYNKASQNEAAMQPIDLEVGGETEARQKKVKQLARAIFGAPRARKG